MVVVPADLLKVVLAVVLAGGIVLSAFGRAPRRRPHGDELRRLVLSAVGLYLIGGLASLTHHGLLAALVFAAGITVAALAAWLSRGTDAEDPPRRDEPVDEQPPPGPDGLPQFDWQAFERDFRVWAALRSREPARRS